eukprot:TRINITY_DN10733_c0_g1_i4.p1 TRINITY_DN10733_c0_g1~~TRINITY_DN10733_c0_g1_i4.p1  ORF type:complete len:167 (+),score=34.06 TRINITY_DN10733_c0_g1_i4:201-701(+)
MKELEFDSAKAEVELVEYKNKVIREEDVYNQYIPRIRSCLDHIHSRYDMEPLKLELNNLDRDISELENSRMYDDKPSEHPEVKDGEGLKIELERIDTHLQLLRSEMDEKQSQIETHTKSCDEYPQKLLQLTSEPLKSGLEVEQLAQEVIFSRRKNASTSLIDQLPC